MATNIGLNVIEVDGTAPSTIQGAAVSVAAFNVLTRRGVPNVPARVTSFTDFKERFGDFDAASSGAYLVKGFFDNGGQRAYVNRVVPKTGTVAATATINHPDPTGAAVPTLKLDAGYRGGLDPGTWCNGTVVTAAPSFQSTIKFTPAPTPTPATPTPATPTPGTPTPGTPTPGTPTPGTPTPTPTPGTPTPTPTPGTPTPTPTPTPGTPTPTPPAAPVTTLAANGAVLGALAGFSVGDAVVVLKGAVASTPTTITAIDVSTGKVTWAPNLVLTGLDGATIVASADFDLAVTPPGADGPTETFERLTMRRGTPNYAVTVLNDPARGSKLVRATDQRANRDVADTLGLNAKVTLLSGLDAAAATLVASDFIGDATARTGFRAFDPLDIQLLCTELTDPLIARAALDYCASRGDCMFIGAVPDGSVAGRSAVEYGGRLQSKNAYGALYGPWIMVVDPMSGAPAPTRRISPVGHVAGMYARIETTRGIHKAPAGDEARLFGAVDVDFDLTDADHTDLVETGSVNGIRAIPGAGIVVDASRTLSTDIRWRYVNVRLLFNYVKSSLKQGLRWVKQEPNRDDLWGAVKHGSVRPFLLGLWRQGAFGSGEPDEVFTVVCDATNNPPDEVDKGNFKVEVYFYPSKPAETILIVVGQQPSGATAADA